MTKRNGWIAFLQWTAAGGAVVFSVISAASIGLFVLPVALVACWLVRRAARIWPESLGGLAGTGAIALFVAFINRNSVPCPERGSDVRLAPGESFSCGGLDPGPWLLTGALLVTASVVVFTRLFRRVNP